MIVKELTVKKAVRYLWLKNVVDVDLTNHCAKCLIGDYVPDVTALHDRYENINLSDGVYYLCGVTIPFNWADNIHLAFEHSHGDRLKIDNEFFKAEIEDARMIEISDAAIDKAHPKARYKKYNTCRNWWFANWYKNK